MAEWVATLRGGAKVAVGEQKLLQFHYSLFQPSTQPACFPMLLLHQINAHTCTHCACACVCACVLVCVCVCDGRHMMVCLEFTQGRSAPGSSAGWRCPPQAAPRRCSLGPETAVRRWHAWSAWRAAAARDRRQLCGDAWVRAMWSLSHRIGHRPRLHKNHHLMLVHVKIRRGAQCAEKSFPDQGLGLAWL